MSELHVTYPIEESLVRICEFIHNERAALIAGSLPADWHNRVSYLAIATLRSVRATNEEHGRLAELAMSKDWAPELGGDDV